MSEKIYCGNGKEKKFNNGGSVVRVVLDIETLQKNFKAHGFITKTGKKKMTINVATNREPDQFGNTHNVTIDTWKPDSNYSQQQGNNDVSQFEDDIPF